MKEKPHDKQAKTKPKTPLHFQGIKDKEKSLKASWDRGKGGIKQQTRTYKASEAITMESWVFFNLLLCNQSVWRLNENIVRYQTSQKVYLSPFLGHTPSKQGSKAKKRERGRRVSQVPPQEGETVGFHGEGFRGRGHSTPTKSGLGLDRRRLAYGPTLCYTLPAVFRGYRRACIRLGSDRYRWKTKEIRTKPLSQEEEKAVWENSTITPH